MEGTPSPLNLGSGTQRVASGAGQLWCKGDVLEEARESRQFREVPKARLEG